MYMSFAKKKCSIMLLDAQYVGDIGPPLIFLK